MKLIFSLLAAAFLAGCSTPTTGIIPSGDGLKSVTRQGSGFWVTTDSLKTAAILEGDANCKSEGKTIRVIHSKEIQAGGGRWPEAEILFKCE